MTDNPYDDPAFFAGYATLPRSVHGLDGAPEWPSLRALLPPLAGLDVLDLGCGHGWFSRHAAGEGARRVLGLDSSRLMLARAREANAHPAVSYAHADLEAAEFPPASFDLAWSSLALHYVERLEALLVRVHAALRPGGIVLLQTPNGEGVGCGHIVYGDLTHETIFNESSLNQFFAAFGFREIAVRETGPVPRNVSGVFRTIVWKLIRLAAQVGAFAQAGRWPRILTATIVATARKP